MTTPTPPIPPHIPSRLHARLSTVEDASFQQLIDELYHCIGWERDDEQLVTCFYLLSAIGVQAPATLSQDRLPGEGILTEKVNSLPAGAVAELCRELVALKRTHIEAFDGKAVLTLIKECFPWPERPVKRAPSSTEEHLDRLTNLILQRRANGDL